MTTTRQHIEDLDPAAWAALTKRAAAASVAAAERLGMQPPTELLAVSAMTERELVDHRNRFGPAARRLSPVLRLVEADHLRVVAEAAARQAEQDKKDAEAAAEAARKEAEQAARDLTAARERTREVEAEAARERAEWAAERATAQQAMEQVRDALERLRADTAAQLATANEQLKAAEARAEQRLTERADERKAAESALEQVRAELERVRADTAAELAKAAEQVSAAEARAEQRITERAAERATAQQALSQAQSELERVRADAEAEVAAARGQAAGEIAAAHQAAEADVSRARAEAETAVAQARTEVEQIRAEADNAVAQARTELERVRASAAAEVAAAQAHASQEIAAALAQPQLLTIPIPPLGVGTHTGYIEHAVSVLRQIDYVLEAGLAEDGRPRTPIDVALVRSLVSTAQEQAGDLADQLRNLPSRYSAQWQVEAAESYAGAATNAYGGLLQRIATATEQLRQYSHQYDDGINAEVVDLVSQMLAEHPWRRP